MLIEMQIGMVQTLEAENLNRAVLKSGCCPKLGCLMGKKKTIIKQNQSDKAKYTPFVMSP